MYDYFYAVFKNKLPILNVCPSSRITAQMMGHHLLFSAPFSTNMFFSLCCQYTVIRAGMLSQAHHNRGCDQHVCQIGGVYDTSTPTATRVMSCISINGPSRYFSFLRVSINRQYLFPLFCFFTTILGIEWFIFLKQLQCYFVAKVKVTVQKVALLGCFLELSGTDGNSQLYSIASQLFICTVAR